MDGLWIICLVLFITQNMGYRIQEEGNLQTVIALYGEKVRIICQDDFPLQQCGFLQPNGPKIVFSDLQYGTPECSVDVEVVEEKIGLWSCRLVPQDSTRVIEKLIDVRVGGRLAAVESDVVVPTGADVTLTCVTTEGRIPLEHCHFVSPTGDVINIDRRTSNLAERYSYPVNKSLDRGDCAVIIRNLSYSDSGLWQCSGRLEHETFAQKADIRLQVADMKTSPANNKIIMYTYMAVISILVLMMITVLVLMWKKFKIIRNSHTTLVEIPCDKDNDWRINECASATKYWR